LDARLDRERKIQRGLQKKGPLSAKGEGGREKNNNLPPEEGVRVHLKCGEEKKGKVSSNDETEVFSTAKGGGEGGGRTVPIPIEVLKLQKKVRSYFWKKKKKGGDGRALG